MTIRYYAQFIPYASQGSSLNGNALYAISEYSFDTEQTLNIGSQATGAGAGRVGFNPLSFKLQSSALTQTLDKALASGTPFEQVRLYAVGSGPDGTVGSTPYAIDTFKLAALKADGINVAAGTHAVTFEYGGLVQSRTAVNPDGTAGATATAGWNRVRNTADMSPLNDVASAAAAPSDPFDPANIVQANPAGDEGLHLFVQLRDSTGHLLGGANGGWIELASAGFDNEQTLNIGSQATGAGAGRVTFDPLSLQFAPGTLEPQLLQTLASGTTLQVEVAAYQNTGGPTAHLVDDYRFATAALKTSKDTLDDGTLSTSYTVAYGQELVTHYDFNPDGSAKAPVTTGWDRVRNVALTSSAAGLASHATATEEGVLNSLAKIASGPSGAGGPVRYYAQFIPYANQGSSLNGNALYAISEYSFDTEQTLNIGSQATGAGAGRVGFNPLSFKLQSSALTQTLDKALASGTPFEQVRLYAVGSGPGGTVGSKPYAVDTFKLAALKTDTIDAAAGTHAVTFEYGGLVQSRTALNPDGTAGATATAGWNRVRNTADISPLNDVASAAAAPSDPFDPANIVQANPAGDEGLHLFVQLRDSTGHLLGGANGGWIELASAHFENEQTLNIGSQATGAGAGRVTFDPLSLQFAPGTLEPQLLQTLASGTTLQVEVAAYQNTSGPTAHLVDDYRFATAALKTSKDTLADGALTTTYTVAYGQELVTHYDFNPDGSAKAPVTTGWDRIRNVSVTSIDPILNSRAISNAALTSSALSPNSHATATEAGVLNSLAKIASGPSGGGGPARYYVQFIPYANQGSSLSGNALYAISEYSFDTEQTLNIGSQSSGAGAGRVGFNPLSFTLQSSALTQTLDKALASGTPFEQVRLYAVGSGPDGTVGSTPYAVDTFKLAALKTDTIDAAAGTHAVTFEYGGLVQSRTAVNPDGTAGATATAGWNRVRNTADMSPLNDVASAAAAPSDPFDPANIVQANPAGDEGLHLFVQLRDSTGHLLGGANGGWIELASAGFDNEQTLNIGSQATGAGAGRVTFDPLSLQFAPGTLEPQLLQRLSSGTTLQVEVAAYQNTGGSAGHLVDDYRFATAALKTSADTLDDGTLSTSYTVAYGQELVTHYDFNPDGSAKAPVTTGWDRVRNVALTSSAAGLASHATTTEEGVLNSLAKIASGPSRGGGPADTTPPVVTASATNQTVMAASAAGSVETFIASSRDDVDGTSDPIIFLESRSDGTTATVLSGSVFGLGTHSITAQSTDRAGNVGRSAPFTFAVVLTEPVLSGLSATLGASGPPGTAATLSGHVSDPGSTVAIYNGAPIAANLIGLATVQADGAWTLSTTLADGRYATLRAMATNDAGASSLAFPAVLETGIAERPYGSTNASIGADGRTSSITSTTATGATYAVLTYGADGSYTVAHPGITGQPYTTLTNLYAADGTQSGFTLGGFTSEPYSSTTDTFAPGTKHTAFKTFYRDDGSVYGVLTRLPDGTDAMAHPGITGQPYTAFTNTYTPATVLVGSSYTGYTGGSYDTDDRSYAATGQPVFEAFIKAGVVAQTTTYDAAGAAQDTTTYIAGQDVTNAGLFEKAGTADTWNVGSPFDNSGTVRAESGVLQFDHGVANAGTIDVGSYAKVGVAGALTGAGTVALHGDGSVFELGAGSTNTVAFTDASAATLRLDDPSAFDGQIQGFGSHSTLDLKGFSGMSTLGFAPNATSTAGTLTVSDGSRNASLALVGSYAPNDFAIDLAGGGILIRHA